MPSYEKRESGLWTVRFRIEAPGKPPIQKRLSGFKTKKDAQYAYEDFISEQSKQLKQPEPVEDPEPEEMTFGQVIDLYYEYEKPRVKPSSFYDISGKIEKHFRPFFGDMKISEITPLVVNRFFSTLSGLSYGHVKRLVGHLNAIWNFAKKYLDIPNVLEKVDKPRRSGEPKKEMQIWTPEEFARFIGVITDEPDIRMLFEFLYLTGCRRGEACALSWDDFDFEKKTVKISKSISYKPTGIDIPYSITTPKNDTSNRRVPLSDALCADLIEYRLEQAERCEKPVFAFGGSAPLKGSTVDRRIGQYAEKAGLKPIRVHDLRHSFTSLMLSRGVPITAVSKALGHANVTQTLNTYAHLMPSDADLIVSVINSVKF